MIINHLQSMKIHRDDFIEALWIRIENALVKLLNIFFDLVLFSV